MIHVPVSLGNCLAKQIHYLIAEDLDQGISILRPAIFCPGQPAKHVDSARRFCLDKRFWFKGNGKRSFANQFDCFL